MMQAVIAGKPVAAVPYNPDQLIHAFRIQELGLGKTVTRLNHFTFFPLKWERIMNLGSTVAVEQVTHTVASIYDNYQSFKQNVDRFRSQSPTTNGAALAADVIENNTKK